MQAVIWKRARRLIHPDRYRLVESPGPQRLARLQHEIPVDPTPNMFEHDKTATLAALCHDLCLDPSPHSS
jgi:hypothetical protein